MLHNTSRKLHRTRPRQPPQRTPPVHPPHAQYPLHINAPSTHARHATRRSPLSKPQHGFSPNPKPLFIQRNPTSTSQRCHNFNTNTSNGTGNCHPPCPSGIACTQQAALAVAPTHARGPSATPCALPTSAVASTVLSLYTRGRPRPAVSSCGRSHPRKSWRGRTQQTVFGNSNLPNAWVSPRPSPTHSSRCSARPAASSHARTRCRLAIQPWISERREVGWA
jgi:hypothetical protein